MRILPILCLTILFFSCNSPAPQDAGESTAPAVQETDKIITADAQAVLAENTTPGEVEAKPRPRTVAVETQATTENIKPRPVVRPNIVLEENSKQELSEKKPKQGIHITEEATVADVTPPPAPRVEEESTPAPAAKTQPEHTAWDELLRNNVSSSGQVNYRSLKSNVAALDAYLEELAQYPPQSDWSKNEIMAYWINAYNAYTVKLIINNYPVSSIKDIDGGNPWGTKWIKIGGKTYSLNQIENDILRARYGDARIHFAVNCAAASCPPLYNRAFTANNLNSNLQRLTRKFINNSSYNTLSAEKIEISKIFEWYAADFGSVKDYINGYTDTTIGDNTTVVYKEYDWGLNGK